MKNFPATPHLPFFTQKILCGPISRQTTRSAFSLVEVTLSIGIVSFCLLGLIGLMPVGLSAVKAAREEAAASNCLNYLATAIRKASPGTNGSYAVGAFSSDLSWTVGGGNFGRDLKSLSFAGTTTGDEVDKRLVARVEIQPPASSASTGKALISVAWPQSATWTNSNWQNAQGSVSTWLVFLPNP